MGRHRFAICGVVALAAAAVAPAQPYDFSEADALLAAELADLDGHVAVLVRQAGVEIYRFQAGDIDFDTVTRLASLTKTVSAGVILALADEGFLALDERLGDALPLFELRGLGEPTLRDAWGMRHGIDSLVPYERDPRFTLEESVNLLGLTGYLVFEPPGSQLGYDGAGMQATGRIAELRLPGLDWESIARIWILDPCDMPATDYGQFAPNPSIPGGLRSSAEEILRYGEMILDRGWCGDARVLSDAAIDALFTNQTRGLPVFASPWPATHPLYPYGVDPDYAFGAWVLAENPESAHVEEIVGAGAWGSFLWIDRRRALVAVLVTDVPAGSQASMDAALGLMDVARRQTEGAQATALVAAPSGDRTHLAWSPPPGALATRLYGAATPIRDHFDLGAATDLGESAGGSARVEPHAFYAATARFAGLENRALVPGSNSVEGAPFGGPWLFADAFESGDTIAWTLTAP